MNSIIKTSEIKEIPIVTQEAQPIELGKAIAKNRCIIITVMRTQLLNIDTPLYEFLNEFWPSCLE